MQLTSLVYLFLMLRLVQLDQLLEYTAFSPSLQQLLQQQHRCQIKKWSQ